MLKSMLWDLAMHTNLLKGKYQLHKLQPQMLMQIISMQNRYLKTVHLLPNVSTK